jgi:tRNA A37 threonylcarbamoyladenosine dehydratase
LPVSVGSTKRLPVVGVYRMDDDVYERQRRIWNQEKIGRMRALVGGAGALGNEIVKNLVQIGVKRVYVVDFERWRSSPGGRGSSTAMSRSSPFTETSRT